VAAPCRGAQRRIAGAKYQLECRFAKLRIQSSFMPTASSTPTAESRRLPHPSEALQPELAAHIHHLQAHWQNALQQFDYDGAWLSAGEESLYFQDDHGPKFKANPYLCQWVNPEYISPGSRLLLRPEQRPVLFLFAPTDYWHAPPPLPEELNELLEIRTYADPKELLSACQQAVQGQPRLAHIGPEAVDNETVGENNPTALLDYLHFHRARKSEYELAAMRLASDVGAAGHLAAAESFAEGGTEFEIHMAFLAASQQAEVDLPYGNIVAINQHAAILHYQHQQRSHPQAPRSLLIDAGGSYRGYASDITRTYAADHPRNDAFATLIELMEAHQQQLIAAIEPGVTFAELHVQMHRQLAGVLADSGLITCSPEAAFDSGLTEKFCPHGLGHLLGLQVHDVGGHLADDQGTAAPPPANYPSLRFTRAVEADHVFTIEPGLYFIPSLLDELRREQAPVDWSTVEDLQDCGGIRIEDNVRVLTSGVENLTRDAFARQTGV